MLFQLKWGCSMFFFSIASWEIDHPMGWLPRHAQGTDLFDVTYFNLGTAEVADGPKGSIFQGQRVSWTHVLHPFVFFCVGGCFHVESKPIICPIKIALTWSIAQGWDNPLVAIESWEAKTTDPQQRLLLTAAYDALRGDGLSAAMVGDCRAIGLDAICKLV